MECADGSGALSQRMCCILFYAGSTDDIAINYTLLAISICAAYCLLEQFSSNFSSSVSSGYRSDAFVAFLGVIVFQIGLCLLLGCSGVSIIWACILGWMLNETGEFSFVHNANATASKPAIVVLAMILNGSAIVYYAIYFPIVTTVAHILAVLLGAAISLRMMRRRACREEQLGLLAVEERESNDSKEVGLKFSGNGAS
mmetsp:Transcript_8987/g.13274  ORF Transcript_8987/g.13274 Transcript_8987/m.13274 type:complete len:199 (+) Transcript_8987:203-799(+)